MTDLERKLHETKTLIPDVPSRLDAKMEERLNAPTKVKRLPLFRLRFALTAAAVASVALSAAAIIVFKPQLTREQGYASLVHHLPQAKVIKNLNEDVVNRNAVKALAKLEPYLTNEAEEDVVLSPATYSLALAGLSAVSENFNNDAFGFINAENDVKALLEAWNYEFETEGSYSFFRSAVLHQQVGPKYAFDKNKQEAISDHYISTMVSSHDSYRSDADKFFSKKIGLDLKVPDLGLEGDSVVTYGVLKMKDYVANGLDNKIKPFAFKDGVGETMAYVFGEDGPPAYIKYYKGENYQVFEVNISVTDLLIILPDEGININDVNVTEAYTKFMSEAVRVTAIGYVPFFHNKVEGLNLTDSLADVITHNEIYLTKLLKDDVFNDLVITAIMQSNDFEFNEYGVAGESITAVITSYTSGPPQDPPIDLSVNRPFYALSLKDDYPIFINKVSCPGK